MKRLILFICIIVILFTLLSGCSSQNIKNNHTVADITTDVINIQNTTTTENKISSEETTTNKLNIITGTTITITEGTTEMKIDMSSKEKEITQIFLDNKDDFEKIKGIITDNYPYFNVRYEGEGFIYNTIKAGKDRKTATDDVKEIDYILNFMKSISIISIGIPDLGPEYPRKIYFTIRYNNDYQGIQYIYNPEDDSYYDDFNKNNLSILRRIEGNWFYYYNCPPDAPIG